MSQEKKVGFAFVSVLCIMKARSGAQRLIKSCIIIKTKEDEPWVE